MAKKWKVVYLRINFAKLDFQSKCTIYWVLTVWFSLGVTDIPTTSWRQRPVVIKWDMEKSKSPEVVLGKNKTSLQYHK